MSELSPEHVALIEAANFGVLATIRADGTPHVSVVWVHTDGSVVLCNTVRGRAKEAHLRRDPRATVTVWNAENPYQYVEVSGSVELVDEGAEDDIDFLARKYLDADSYPDHSDEKRRVIVRLTPERVGSYGFSSS
jgi:PPOX class probable F420-dependent enzyme